MAAYTSGKVHLLDPSGVVQDYYFSWKVISESTINTKSTISWTLTSGVLSDDYVFTTLSGVNLFLDGKRQGTVNSGIRLEPGESAELCSGTYTVVKDSVTNIGTFIVSITLTGQVTYQSKYSDTIYNFTLPGNEPYQRKTVEVASARQDGAGAAIFAVSDFTDETNPTITYQYIQPSDVATATVEACISFTGATDDIEYRPISIDETTYTFELTGTERSKFWTLLDAGTTATVRFYLRTNETLITGETKSTGYNYITKTFNFVNYKPVITTSSDDIPLVEDANSDTLALTGDSRTMVRYYSTAHINAEAIARKGATITSYEVRNGDITLNTFSEQIPNITSNTFYFSATDNRGHTTNEAAVFNNLSDLKWIEYIRPTCKISHEPMNGEGELVVTITGKYFEGSFGSVPNTLSLEYDIHDNDIVYDEGVIPWQVWGTIEPNVDSEHNYEYTFTITGLDHTKMQHLHIRVIDALTLAEAEAAYIPSAESLFDWSQYDFNFNIPVSLTGGYMYPQWILWQLPESPTQDDINNALLGDGVEITLDHPISEQPSGIVLVFSLYRNGAIEDKSVQSFFVSRVEVTHLLSACPHTFMMAINSNMSVFGAKYITISDTKLRGFEGNTNSGTASGSGITFDNSKFVLRYVIGV